MNHIKGIYAAGMSILDNNLVLDIKKTILHSENLIEQGCHGVAIFGSTGQAQLISMSEKINLLNELSKSKLKKKFIIGTGLNSLNDTVNLMKIGISLGFKNFLVMPPAYYSYTDKEVITFYEKLISNNPDCQIILYSFEKLCGYKFSIECVEYLAKKFPRQIVGVKDSSYNLYEKLKIKDFSVLPGSELKLLRGLELGCAGIITATCNATASLARKVFDDFQNKRDQTHNEKLCNVRKVFDKYNLISGMHSYFSDVDKDYENILPPLTLLSVEDKKQLSVDLNKLEFNTNKIKVI